MTVRPYRPADFATVESWAKARGLPLHEILLSPNGFMAEDERGPCAAVWVYLMFDVPVAIVDNLHTRPGLSVRQARAVWGVLWNCCKSFLANLKDCNNTPITYKVVRTFTRPALVRFAKADGWIISPEPMHEAAYALPPPGSP